MVSRRVRVLAKRFRSGRRGEAMARGNEENERKSERWNGPRRARVASSWLLLLDAAAPASILFRGVSVGSFGAEGRLSLDSAAAGVGG